MKVLNFGSLNYDDVYQVDHIIMPGETQTSKAVQTFCGGKGLNQSIALAKAGVHVYHAGSVGEDGQGLLDICSENGVDTTYIRSIAGKSGHTIIQIDKKAQNSILLYGGANRAQDKEYIGEVLSHFEKGDILLLQNEINCLDYMIDCAYERNMTIILNPSPFDGYLDACDLSKVSVFLMNEVEGEQIAGTNEPEEILDWMKKEFPAAGVVLTLGIDGAAYQDARMRIWQESIPVQAVDTTAAGDTFTGYFIAGLIKGMEPKDILFMCSRASAIAVSRNGAAASIPSMEELEID